MTRCCIQEIGLSTTRYGWYNPVILFDEIIEAIFSFKDEDNDDSVNKEILAQLVNQCNDNVIRRTSGENSKSPHNGEGRGAMENRPSRGRYMSSSDSMVTWRGSSRASAARHPSTSTSNSSTYVPPFRRINSSIGDKDDNWRRK